MEIRIKPRKGQKIVEPATDTDAEFYGIYLVEDDGTEEWIADAPTREEAHEIAQQLVHEAGLPWQVISPGWWLDGDTLRPTHDEETGELRVSPYRGLHIVNRFGRPVAEFVSDEWDARRIVACVNACKGIPTEPLECQSKRDLSAKLIETNKALLAALEDVIALAESAMRDVGEYDIDAELAEARRVISLAKTV